MHQIIFSFHLRAHISAPDSYSFTLSAAFLILIVQLTYACSTSQRQVLFASLLALCSGEKKEEVPLILSALPPWTLGCPEKGLLAFVVSACKDVDQVCPFKLMRCTESQGELEGGAVFLPSCGGSFYSYLKTQINHFSFLQQLNLIFQRYYYHQYFPLNFLFWNFSSIQNNGGKKMNPFTPDPDPPIWPHLLVLSCLSVPPPFFSGFNIHILAFLAGLFEINCSHHTFTSKYFLMNLLRIFLCVTLMSLPDKMNSISLYHLLCSPYSFIQFRILLRVVPVPGCYHSSVALWCNTWTICLMTSFMSLWHCILWRVQASLLVKHPTF